MRSSVSYMLSHGSGEPIMSHPDYEQHAYHHSCLLVLVRGIGPSKPRSLQKIFERLQSVNNVKIPDSNGLIRDIWIRYVQEHPIENNDWGDFQTHRRLIGLITVGKFDNQPELNELCRVHESLKVKYSGTLYDSRCILFGPKENNTQKIVGQSKPNDDIENCPIENLQNTKSEMIDNNDLLNNVEQEKAAVENGDVNLEDLYTKPSNFKSRAFFYPEYDPCKNLEVNIIEFINSLFWVLESKRLDRSREKIDRVSLLVAPFEKRDFVGLDMETRNNRKRLMGRITKNLADLTLQAGMIAESLELFHSASETLRAINDSLWLGAANEGLCAASSILLYPHARQRLLPPQQSNESAAAAAAASTHRQQQHERNQSLSGQENLTKQVLNKKTGLAINLEQTPIGLPLKSNSNNINSSSVSSSTSSVSSMLSNSSSSAGTPSSSISSVDRFREQLPLGPSYPANILQPEEIKLRYRDAIINYSKYRNAGIIETEAALKAARICIEQGQNLDVVMFLQNVLYIDLNMTESKRVQRLETLADLYQRIGYNRKAAFCQRLAAWRHVAQNNANPDWAQSYRLMLDCFSGYRMSLDPMEMLRTDTGWPCLQIDLVQQLIEAARRLGHSALATRHMTFLLQTMWSKLSPTEQREFSLQLQNLSAQCEGAPVPLHLENGTIIPAANLTDLPICELFQLANLAPHLRPQKIQSAKVDNGPFLFTPIHYSCSNDRKNSSKKNSGKISFHWIQHDLCEVTLKLRNPLPFEMRLDDMRLLSNGIVFESLPQSITLPTNVSTTITLHGTPIEHGALVLVGYSTHALGVKSECHLRDMQHQKFTNNFQIDVIPALPKLDIQTSLPQSATFSAMANSDCVIVSASITMYNGETSECILTLTNNSNTPIEYIEESIQSALDLKTQNHIFQWSHDEIQSKLPIMPNDFITFKLYIFGDADFLGPVTAAAGITSLTPSQQNHHHHLGHHHHHHHQQSADGPHSIIGGMSTLSVSGNASLPSRMNSPINMPPPQPPIRRTELTSSFRSTHSGHSSLASMSLTAPNNSGLTRHLEVQFRFRYSGGDGFHEGYCRQCAVMFSLELLPSAQITNWDVLPAEIPSQFYLVLDVVNLTNQEMSLNYTASKNILIEAKESCRVPIPVERCPLNRLNVDEIMPPNPDCPSILSGATEVDLVEKVCSEHISENIKLQWTLGGTETHGIASLKGIGLSSAMLGLITVAPLQWEICVNNSPIAPQSEITCSVGQNISIGIRIRNVSPTTLHHLTLSTQFYQDLQNGVHNYKLETRVITSGQDHVVISVLNQNDSIFHECSALFFTPGRFKVDIQCCADSSSRYSAAMTTTATAAAAGIGSPNYCIGGGQLLQQSAIGISGLKFDMQIWRFIPPLEITVVE